MRSETELLREALIGSVSHELRTPLASILGAATVLAQCAGDRQGRAASARSPAWSATRPSGSTTTSRICSTRHASAANRSSRGRNGSSPPTSSIRRCERRRRRLAGHNVSLDMDSNLPFIYVDPMLVEQAFVQVVDNAAKYSPPGSAITRDGQARMAATSCSSVNDTRRRPDRRGDARSLASVSSAAPRHAAHHVRLRPRPVDRQGVRGRQRRQDRGRQRGRRSGNDGVDHAAACTARSATRGGPR